VHSACDHGNPSRAKVCHACGALLAREGVHDEIVEYATVMAGSPADLDEGIEEAAVDHLVASGRKR